MDRFEKAAQFGQTMGKKASIGGTLGNIVRDSVLNPTASETNRALVSTIWPALIGGLGTAGYDWAKGNKDKRIRRALLGAGAAGLLGYGGSTTASILDRLKEYDLVKK